MSNVTVQSSKVDIIKTDSGEIKLSPQIIRQYLVNGNGKVTDQEVMMFLGLCKGQRLNPFTKEAYLIKYGDSSPATVVVSKDVFMKRAVKNPDFNGIESGVIVLNQDNEIVHKTGALYVKDFEKLIGAWATVHRKSWQHPLTVEVNYDEYVGLVSGKPNRQWSSKPATMIVKVAKAQALREAFVEDLGGMYDDSEMNVDITNLQQEGQVVAEVNEVEQTKQAYKESIPKVENGNDVF